MYLSRVPTYHHHQSEQNIKMYNILIQPRRSYLFYAHPYYVVLCTDSQNLTKHDDDHRDDRSMRWV
jgi:hypothetical protein